MVSYQTPLNNCQNTISEYDQDVNNLKRKWDSPAKDEDRLPYKHWKTNPKAFVTKSFSDIELHLETPLPSEWQRCLDIQSGKIHFYNSRTQKRTVRDPRESLELNSSSPRDSHMSLELQLNLPCDSLNSPNIFSKANPEKSTITATAVTTTSTTTTTTTTKKKRFSNSPPTPQPPSSTELFRSLQNAVEKMNGGNNNIEAEEETAEMVATACKRCHMLVMLCKSAPTCPNCKYVHPPCQKLLDLKTMNECDKFI